MGKLRTYFSIFILFWTACAPLNPDAIRIDETIDVSTDEPTRASATEAPAEASVIVIPLTDPIAIRDAEISGLAWYGDYLVLLPQYPNIFTTQEDGYIFALPKSEIIAFLGGESTEPLDPIQIPFIAPGLRQDIAGFEGYEAIAFDGNNVYVTIEAWAPDIMRAYLLTGTISPDLSSLTLDTTTQLTIGAQSDIGNMSDETLLFADGSLLTIYEANGAAVNEIPVAHVFNGDLTGVVHFRRTIRFTFLQREKMFIFSTLSHAQAENDLI
ncbi:hypothetical protein KFU94_51270 [Chloroflexi bacterium TSY]|nr:hypothetical protein [Chloroflexi bacterium TSY]